ncbi:Erythroid membrane-associated protein [Larimichthys crocea]|uniref:Erythroid membrane-associated protein n=1 Tax=Larimichthys crocea TaxID=215358 RepID=A0A6G0HJP9_LARCR|nr:Erythroid membrane-associated protein [Larimichthys crocea]
MSSCRVTWWRAGIPPDPGDPVSENRFVHMYRDYHDVEDMKMESYAGRTTLDKDGLKHGNISLKITNVRLSDQGRYRCLIPELWSASVIKLVVVPNSVQTPTTETFHSRTLQTQDPENEMTVSVVVFCVTLILGGGVCGYFFKLKRERCKNLQDYDVAPNKPPPV